MGLWVFPIFCYLLARLVLMKSAILPVKTHKHRAYSYSKAIALAHAAYCCAWAQTPIVEMTCSSTEPIQCWKYMKLPRTVLQATGAVACEHRVSKATFAREKNSKNNVKARNLWQHF